MSGEGYLDLIFSRIHGHLYEKTDVFSLPTRYTVLPGATGVIIKIESIDAVIADLLRVSLEYNPDPTPGQHDPTVFRHFWVQICGKRCIITASQLSPGDIGPHEAALTIGSHKLKAAGQNVCAAENCLQGCFFSSRKVSDRALAMLAGSVFKNRYFQAEMAPLLRCLQGGKKSK